MKKQLLFISEMHFHIIVVDKIIMNYYKYT
jgi:hypothetical protein